MTDEMPATPSSLLPAEEGSSLLRAYLAWLSDQDRRFPKGSWVGRDEHRQRFLAAAQSPPEDLAELVLTVLQTEPRLSLRYEALRLGAFADLRAALLPHLSAFLDLAPVFPLIRRRIRLLHDLWSLPSLALGPQDELRRHLWFDPPGPLSEIQEYLRLLDRQGEDGLFAIERLLSDLLTENKLLDEGSLSVIEAAAGLFAESQAFDSAPILLDLLTEIRPSSPPDPPIQQAVGSLLRALRKLRPYRYPRWAAPLRRWAEHYRSLGQAGRAAEAKMLSILIGSSTTEEALLLETEEIVDLLRGRRDAAYTDDDLHAVLELCDAILPEHPDSRIFHIRGWLEARLHGPASAIPFFVQALEIDPGHATPHIALASIFETNGQEDIARHHLEAACSCDPSFISCHRRYGQWLEDEGDLEGAAQIYQRGLDIRPTQATDFELEEWFGCLSSLAHLFTQIGHPDMALQMLDHADPSILQDRFGIRFIHQRRVIIHLLSKGIRDLRAEIARHVAPASPPPSPASEPPSSAPQEPASEVAP